MKKILCLTTLIFLSSSAGLADIARPKEPKPTPAPRQSRSIDTTLMIRLKSDAKEARLIIPKSQIKQLRAELDQLDDDSDTTAAATSSFSRTQTIVSGMFLSLAFVFGGFWFVRSGKAATKTGKTFVILAILAGIGSAATFVYANAGPPAEARSITGKMFTQAVHFYKFGSGKIKLETSNNATNVELIVPDPQPAPSGEE